MRRITKALAMALGFGITVLPSLALADSITSGVKDTAKATGSTVKEGAKTGAGAVKDTGKTVGKTTKTTVKHGPSAGVDEAKSGGHQTKENAKAGGQDTGDAARGE